MLRDLSPRKESVIQSVQSQTPLDFLHRTKDFLLVYKPSGLVVQGADAHGNLLACVAEQTGTKAYPVHRLDQGTSGLVLVATAEAVNRQLSLAFQQKQVEKYYLALVDRKPKKKQGSIIGDMNKTRNGNWRLCQSRDNPAVTSFFSFGLGNGLRLILLKPKTGKTHQLRVALKALGAPIVGDVRYGGTPSDRLYLHAYDLRFTFAGQYYAFREPPREGDFFLRPECKDTLHQLGDPGNFPWPDEAR